MERKTGSLENAVNTSAEQHTGLCPHMNMPGMCLTCAQDKKEGGIKARVEEIICRSSRENREKVLEQLASKTPDEINRVIKEAMKFVSDPDRQDQFHLGGNFNGPEGERGRRLVTLYHPEKQKDNLFLDYLALKIVKTPNSKKRASVVGEIRTHALIEAALEELGDEAKFRVPLLMALEDLPEAGAVGVVMERLPRDPNSASLQTFEESAKRQKHVARISDDLALDIRQAFKQFHKLGFHHGDINTGNVYITNASIETYELPKASGKPRPTTEFIHEGTVYLLDFERTLPMPIREAEAKEDSVNELNEMQETLGAMHLEVDYGADIEDLIDANDEFFKIRRAG